MPINKAITQRQLQVFSEHHQLPNETIVAYSFLLGDGIVLTDKRLVKVNLKFTHNAVEAIVLSDIRAVKNKLTVAEVQGSEHTIGIQGQYKNFLVKAIQALQVDNSADTIRILQNEFGEEMWGVLESTGASTQASTLQPSESNERPNGGSSESQQTTQQSSGVQNMPGPNNRPINKPIKKKMSWGRKLLYGFGGFIAFTVIMAKLKPDAYEELTPAKQTELQNTYKTALAVEQQKPLSDMLYEDVVQANANDKPFQSFIGQRVKWFAKIEEIQTSKSAGDTGCKIELTSRKRAPMSPNIFVALPCYAWTDIKANIESLYSHIEVVGTIHKVDSAMFLPDVHLRYPEIIVDSEAAIAYQVEETRKEKLKKIKSEVLIACANEAEITAMRNNWQFEYGDEPSSFYHNQAQQKYVMLYHWKVLNAFGVYMGKTTRCEFSQAYVDGETHRFQVGTSDRGVVGRD